MYRGQANYLYDRSNYNNTNNNETLGKINNIFNTGLKGGISYTRTGKTPWGAIGAVGKQSYNLISGKKDKDYSDLEESIIYPLQGASRQIKIK